MGKVFSNLAELNRTYTEPVTGANYVKKEKERDAEGFRLKDFVFTHKKMIRLTRFSALLQRGDNFSPVDICEAWGSQDFYVYASTFEQQNSVLCTHAHVLSNNSVRSGGPGQSFMPIVVDTGNLDAYVVGHTGIVMGDRLVLPQTPWNQRNWAVSPELALFRGIPFYVIAQGANPPDGWGLLSVADKRFQVVVKPDGQVTHLKLESTRSLVSANWVIDLVVTPATLALAKWGKRMVMSVSVMETKAVGRAPQLLAGPTREVAKEATDAAAAKVAAARVRIQNELALAKTHPVPQDALRSTIKVGRGGDTARSTAGSTPRPAAALDPRKAAQKAREDAFWRDLNAEYEAAGSRFTRDQLNTVVDRLEKKHGVDMLDW